MRRIDKLYERVMLPVGWTKTNNVFKLGNKVEIKYEYERVPAPGDTVFYRVYISYKTIDGVDEEIVKNARNETEAKQIGEDIVQKLIKGFSSNKNLSLKNYERG